MFRLKAIVSILLTAIITIVPIVSATPQVADWKNGTYPVIAVIDGDTFKIRIGTKIESVRILGIDAPETSTLRTGSTECYGKESTTFASLSLIGKSVRISRDFTQDPRDKYGRILANVFLSNGSLYAEKAVLSGSAYRYVYANKPVLYDARLLKAEAIAKKNSVGVWEKCQRKEISKPLISPPKRDNGFDCSIKKTICAQMISCQEAKFYLNSCGISRLDGDKDGMPCETICK